MLRVVFSVWFKLGQSVDECENCSFSKVHDTWIEHSKTAVFQVDMGKFIAPIVMKFWILKIIAFLWSLIWDLMGHF